MPVQLSQLVQTLQSTAPAGNPVEDLIQTAPIKAPFIAVGQTVLFGHTPFCKRIGLVLDPLRFVGSDTDIFNDRVIFSQFFQIGVHHTGFEDARTPAVARACPAHAAVLLQCRIFPLWRVVQKVVFKIMLRFQPGNRSADIRLQTGKMLVHLRKFQPCIAKENQVNRPFFFQQAQEHRRRILAAR